MNYILEGKEVRKAKDWFEWGQWYEKNSRHVAKEKIGEIEISTVFLGIDHNMGDSKQPVLFETMVFGGLHDNMCERYCTYAEAEQGHQRIVKLIRDENSDEKELDT